MPGAALLLTGAHLGGLLALAAGTGSLAWYGPAGARRAAVATGLAALLVAAVAPRPGDDVAARLPAWRRGLEAIDTPRALALGRGLGAAGDLRADWLEALVGAGVGGLAAWIGLQAVLYRLAGVGGRGALHGAWVAGLVESVWRSPAAVAALLAAVWISRRGPPGRQAPPPGRRPSRRAGCSRPRRR